MLNLLIGPLTSLASTWLEGKVERSAAKTKAEVQKKLTEAALLEKKASADIDWDIEMAKASGGSWKDEYLTILISVPMILAFCGEWGNKIVAQGFAALEQMPDFYMYAFSVVVAASFGFRGLTKIMGNRK